MNPQQQKFKKYRLYNLSLRIATVNPLQSKQIVASFNGLLSSCFHNLLRRIKVLEDLLRFAFRLK